ncbi:MAG: nucleoside triphosphate pyrophosphohydrolase [Candidatus Methanoplasma sp.]|jgi:predicted house-cleaning noncanonical NTP pyrophosphatase (MazG superfamily)|nr:nucleoside triphosphate pyrophosphohydrolase [Candidatus Methanoplasma sp.]
MTIRVYNKLVRDRIPGIIGDTGDVPTFRLLDDEEYLAALNAKLLEEVAEYNEAKSIEELADVFQVIRTIAEQIGGGLSELQYISREKSLERGGFEMRVFLESVEEKK